MSKIELAKKLLANANAENERLSKGNLSLGDGFERGLLKRYIENYEAVQSGELSNTVDIEEVEEYQDELKHLDLCFERIIFENFEFSEWLLFEIPIDEVYCFVHLSRKHCFDILIDKDKTFTAYVDLDHSQLEATTINEAIQRYYPLLEKQDRELANK